MAEPFSFALVSPERQLMQEPVTQVVVPGAEGYFTMLKGHAPFMSTLRPGIVTITGSDGGSERVFVRGGFADVNENGLTILAELAIPMSELDAAALAQRSGMRRKTWPTPGTTRPGRTPSCASAS